MRAFLGVANYYSAYGENFTKPVAALQKKLKADEGQGKKCSVVKGKWDAESMNSFGYKKAAFCRGLTFRNVRVDQPFVPRFDATGKAISASLEQVPKGHEAKNH